MSVNSAATIRCSRRDPRALRMYAFQRRGYWDAMLNAPFHPGYEGWPGADQANYERGRLIAIEARALGEQLPAWPMEVLLPIRIEALRNRLWRMDRGFVPTRDTHMEAAG